MRVFTDEWIQEIRGRYEKRLAHEHPFLYRVATRRELRLLRDEIAEWVAKLPPTQTRPITNLRAVDNFVTTYHELAVGAVLRQLGYRLDYEKEMQTERGGEVQCLTPDWYVYPKGETPAFIVEVFTANLSDARRSELPQEDDLRRRLERIPVDAALRIDPHNARLDQRRNKCIAREIERWLTEESPPVGARLDFEGITCTVCDRATGCPSVRADVSGVYWVDIDSLRRKIQEKFSKYRKLAEDRMIPLVVAVVPDIETGHDLKTFETALRGNLALQITIDKSTGTAVGQRVIRVNGLLARLAPASSAVIMVCKEPFGEWKMKALHNPTATNPLPANTFSES